MSERPGLARLSAITLRQLRAFVRVARDGSMARAAQNAHLSPSAMSMLVGGLESELGLQLFERTTRRLMLSPAGAELLPVIEKTLGDLQSALERMHELASRQRSRLTIAASPLLASMLLPARLADFKRVCPQIEVTLIDEPVAKVPELIRRGEADIGIVTADAALVDLDSTVLFTDPLMLACRPDHPLARLRSATWSDLSSEGLALLRRGSGLRALIDRGLSTVERIGAPAYEVASVETALGLVENGLAVSILPWYALSRRTHGVVAIPLRGPVIHRDIVALNSRQRALSEQAHAFIREFREAMDKLLQDSAVGEDKTLQKSC